MKKILLISHYSGLHGAERALLTLCTGLSKEIEFLVVTPQRGDLNEELELLGIETKVIGLSRWIEYGTNLHKKEAPYRREVVEELVQLIKDANIDIVHTNTSIILEGALAAREARIPHVWHLHEFLDNHPSLTLPFPVYFTYKVIETLSDRVVVVSQALEQSVKRYVQPEKVQTIPNGVFHTRQTGDVRAELGLPEKSFVITNVGTSSKEKGSEALLEAAIRICNSLPDTVFLMVGPQADTALHEKLLQKVNDHCLTDRILYLGFRNDVPKILADTDIYVCASLTETFGLSLVEAMSFGNPVISTRCGGPEEIVDHNATGLLVEVDDVDQMVSAITKLYHSPSLRKAFGMAGLEKYSSQFTPETYLASFKALYWSLEKTAGQQDERLSKALLQLLEFDQYRGVAAITPTPYEVSAAERKLAEILNSMSWRVTAPLRAVGSFFPGVMSVLRKMSKSK
ncbi:glycosyltransferase family 4 protein [Geomonas anaerohicana]|uniref:Glycosyltransferase family 4 protein n=1 Tax=Geomonas anaerohicana TaxID=2798583 RepID=A0ABS0YH51_9BACT|nr:glycosyltransferase family 4 protein [Geomonas anaerohicana]MBJ6751582.1 glycosyltransferase family 4 protein [Geomonas anaerohicana]